MFNFPVSDDADMAFGREDYNPLDDFDEDDDWDEDDTEVYPPWTDTGE